MFRQIKKTTQQYLKQCFALQSLMLFLLFQSMGTYGQSRKELCRICEDRSVIDTAYFDALIGKALVHHNLNKWFPCQAKFGSKNRGELKVDEDGNAVYREYGRKNNLLIKIKMDGEYRMEVPQDDYVVCYKVFNGKGRLVKMYRESYLGFTTGKRFKAHITADGTIIGTGVFHDDDDGYKVDYHKVIKVGQKRGFYFKPDEKGLKTYVFRLKLTHTEMLGVSDSFSNWALSLSHGQAPLAVWCISTDNDQFQWREHCLLIDGQSGKVLGERVFKMQESPVSYGHPSPNLKSMSDLMKITEIELRKDDFVPDPRIKNQQNTLLMPFRDSFDQLVRYISFSKGEQSEYDSLKALRRLLNVKMIDTQLLLLADKLVVDSFFNVHRVYKEGQIKRLVLRFYLGFNVVTFNRNQSAWYQDSEDLLYDFDRLIRLCDSMHLWHEPERYDDLSISKIRYSEASVEPTLYLPEYADLPCWRILRREWINGRSKVLIVDAATGKVIQCYYYKYK